MADPFTPWLEFWQQSTRIALATPQLLMQPTNLCSTATSAPSAWGVPSELIESQQQAWEKMCTAGEMWWTLWMGAWSPGALLGLRGWDGQPHPALSLVPPPVFAPPGRVAEAEPRMRRQG